MNKSSGAESSRHYSIHRLVIQEDRMAKKSTVRTSTVFILSWLLGDRRVIEVKHRKERVDDDMK